MKVEWLEERKWLDFLNGCKGSTFFHTPYWYKVWQTYKGYQYEARLYTFSDGQQVIFPLSWRPRMKGLFKEMLSGPAGVYGGPISPNVISRDKFGMIWDNLKQDFDALNTRLCPYQNVVVDSVADKKAGFTQTLFVEDQSIDEIIEGYTKNHQRSFKASKKNELEIYYTASFKEWLEYYSVYQTCVKRWGQQATNAYEIKLFEIIYDLPAEVSKLWLCRYNGDVIAGALAFYFNNSSIYWHGATDANFYKLRPMHLLQTKIVESLLQENLVKYYDFNPSGGHEGVVRFKKGFGAEKMRSDVIRSQSRNMKLLNRLISTSWLKK